jgi:hypothetical protein
VSLILQSRLSIFRTALSTLIAAYAERPGLLLVPMASTTGKRSSPCSVAICNIHLKTIVRDNACSVDGCQNTVMDF